MPFFEQDIALKMHKNNNAIEIFKKIVFHHAKFFIFSLAIRGERLPINTLLLMKELFYFLEYYTAAGVLMSEEKEASIIFSLDLPFCAVDKAFILLSKYKESTHKCILNNFYFQIYLLNSIYSHEDCSAFL